MIGPARVALAAVALAVWFALGAALRVSLPVLAFGVLMVAAAVGTAIHASGLALAVLAAVTWVLVAAVVILYFTVVTDVIVAWFPSYRTTDWESEQARRRLQRRLAYVRRLVTRT